MSGNAFKNRSIPAPWQIADMPSGTPVLLALSGGADSRLLLAILAEQAKRDGFSLTAAHLNHGIRGAEAERDRDFCREICKSHGVELCVRELDIPTLARQSGRGLEEAAREARYAWFAELMEKRQIPILVTAHHADDNAETVLFRLARGTGAAGLGGIAPMRSFASGVLVRPLLGLTKKQICLICEEMQLEYVSDSTNSDTEYARNRLRAEVLPVLESLFSGASLRIGEMSERLREDEAVLSAMAEQFLHEHLTKTGCPIDALKKQPVAIQRRVLGMWLANTRGITPEQVHTTALLKLLDTAEPHAQLSLPGNTTVAVERGMLCITDAEPIPDTAYDLPFCQGETSVCGGRWSVLVEKDQKKRKVHNLSIARYIILTNVSAIMESDLHWRPRRAGDRILLRGMHRSVRKLFCEAEIPLDVRATLPLLCCGEEIVWIPHIGVRDGFGTTDAHANGWYVALFETEGIKNQSDVNRNTEREINHV